MKALLLALILFFSGCKALGSFENPPNPPALLSVGGGYFDAGRHSGKVYEIEYKFGMYPWWKIRPQVGGFTADFRSFYFYGGIGIEFYVTKHLIFSPSFSPGIYFRGSGKNLGHPIEFRSALEIALEANNFSRFGVQFFHVSNAHLSNRNPGANAMIFFFALPI